VEYNKSDQGNPRRGEVQQEETLRVQGWSPPREANQQGPRQCSGERGREEWHLFSSFFLSLLSFLFLFLSLLLFVLVSDSVFAYVP
jgi:hypothetical protein